MNNCHTSSAIRVLGYNFHSQNSYDSYKTGKRGKEPLFPALCSMMKRVSHQARRGEDCNEMGLYACYYWKKEPESLSSEVVIESKRLCPPASLDEHHSSITGEDLQMVVDSGRMERAPEDQQEPIYEDEEEVHSSQYPIGSTFVFDSSSYNPPREAPEADRVDKISANNGSRRLLETGSLNG